MATLVLTVAGGLIGGPVGAAIGSVVGGVFDRVIVRAVYVESLSGHGYFTFL